MTKACYGCYSSVLLPYCMSCLLLKHCAKSDMTCQLQKVGKPKQQLKLHQWTAGSASSRQLTSCLLPSRSISFARFCIAHRVDVG